MWKYRNETLCAVCDVGSATVSAGLVLFSPDKKPSILWTTRVPFSVVEIPNQRHLEAVMFELLENAFSQIVSTGLPFIHSQGIREKKVEQVFLTLASPWFSAKASSVSVVKDDPFILDEKTIADSVQGEEKKFEDDAIKGLYEQVRGQDIRMIEREIVRVLLNGYETKNPYNKYAKSAGLSLYMSIIPERILVGAQKLVRDHLHTDKIAFHTFPLSFFTATNNLFPHNEDSLLIDIAGESTDISVVRGGTIEHTSSFPLGKNTLLRSLISDLQITEEIALSYLHLDVVKGAGEELRTQIQGSIMKHMDVWKENLHSLFAGIQKTGSIPHASFVLCDEESAVPFLECLKSTGLLFGISHIVPVTAKMLEDHVETRKFATPDQFIAIEALHMQFLRSKGRI